MPSQTLQLLSPCFSAGSIKAVPEIRAPSIRGHLHFWARVLFGPEGEYRLLGGIKGKDFGFKSEAVASRFAIQVGIRSDYRPVEASLCAHDPRKGNREAVPEGTEFDLVWNESPSEGKGTVEDFERLLKTWCLLGSLGARSNRAAGSVWPVQFQPTVEDFEKLVLSLIGSLRVEVRVFVLSRIAGAEELRRIACDTINGLTRGSFAGDPFGFVDRAERKASPLKFKIGRFSDGLRLITIADNRNGRGGDLKKLIREMATRKEIGKLLAATPLA